MNLKSLLIDLWRNEDGFFGVDMGVSDQQKSNYGNLTNAAGFATNLGEKDLGASSKFMTDILSGDVGKITQALAPQIGAAKSSAQQQNKQNAEFGTRSGGTAASTAATNDKVHSDITNLIGQLTGGAASSLSSVGDSLLGKGMKGDEVGYDIAKDMQQQKEAKFNDIISSSAAVAAAPFTGGASLTGLVSGGNSGMSGGFSMPSFGGGAPGPINASTNPGAFDSMNNLSGIDMSIFK
jgi:hypothetical protein